MIYSFPNIESKIKKIILLLVMMIMAISCQSIVPNYKWYSTKELVENSDKLKPGDILILSKEPTLRSMWGHAAIINENRKIVEFPSYSIGYSESPIYSWRAINRQVSVMRLKNIDDDFRSALFKEIDKTLTKPYGITFNKTFDKRLYCSQFVYLVFKKAGIDVGRNVDLDSNGGGMVMPFDILESPLLENIDLYE
jgi:putative liporotein